MTDQMQGRVLDPDHPCLTPNFDRLAARGVRFERAYTTSATCSPARASLMTGLLPHNHGVLWVTHLVDEDQGLLRTDKPHWAQRLVAAGYRTGYFGKWHVERCEDPSRFGWQVSMPEKGKAFDEHRKQLLGDAPADPTCSLSCYNDQPPGYASSIHYGVTDQPAEHRSAGVTASAASPFLDEAIAGDGPWCCFVSTQQPHDPFIAGCDTFEQYDVEALPVPPNWHDDSPHRPGIYRKQAQLWADRSDRQRREAAACYYANISEVDEQFGKLLDKVEQAGQSENTIIVIGSDHGELLGAHGLYCKNFSAYEEIYNIPLIIAGPGVADGAVSRARVGLHDLGATLLDLVGLESDGPFGSPDSRSVVDAVRDPAAHDRRFSTGFAEYFGGRYMVTQRVVWDGPWKFVHNGFDFDELYNLDDDPWEMHNLSQDPAFHDRVRQMMILAWRYMRDTGDQSLLNTGYPILRAAPVGPGAADESMATE